MQCNQLKTKGIKMKKLGFQVILIGAMSSFVMANPQTGCGLGDMVIKNPNNAIMYVFNWTTNNTFGLQTFGISSGTLGCSRANVVYDERVQEFVAANMDSLSKEIAQGKGENLDTLAELLEVEDKEAFKQKLQKNYQTIYANKNVSMSDILDTIATL